MWRAGYSLLLWFAFPFVLARLWWRGRHEPAYRQNIAERFGFYGRTPARPVIWLHAVSVGETRGAEPLLHALRSRHPGCDLLITQMTATGREAAQQLFGGAALVAWLPYDYPSAVRRFLRSFRPRLGILMETEIWFHLVGDCRRSGVPHDDDDGDGARLAVAAAGGELHQLLRQPRHRPHPGRVV